MSRLRDWLLIAVIGLLWGVIMFMEKFGINSSETLNLENKDHGRAENKTKYDRQVSQGQKG